MKKQTWCVSMQLFVLVTGLTLWKPESSSAEMIQAERIMRPAYWPELMYTIKIELSGGPGPATVHEIPPSGWTIQRISHGGQKADGVITWNLTLSNDQSISLEYFIIPSSDTNGDAVFTGDVNGVETSGAHKMIPASVHLQTIRMPEPTGSFRVGTTSRHWIDESRNQEFMVQFWYPAAVPDGALPGMYNPDIDVIGPASRDFCSVELQTVFENLPANAVPEAPILPGNSSFPVLVYSHSTRGFRAENANLKEELASHGYIVVALDFPGSNSVRFPDGRVVPRGTPRDAETRIIDIQFLLDQLELIHVHDPLGTFTNRFDLSNLGIFGWTNGCAVNEALYREDRFKAGISHEVNPLPGPTNATLLRLESDETVVTRSPLHYLGSGGYFLKIAGVNDVDLWDLSMIWILGSLPRAYFSAQSGYDGRTENPAYYNRMVADFTLAFFDKHLKHKRVYLLDSPWDYVSNPHPDYPEIRLEILGELPSAVSDFLLYR